MASLLNKVKSCKCPKDSSGNYNCTKCQSNLAGAGVDGTGACDCKTNKCKCAGCPNARKSVKAGARTKGAGRKRSDSSSSSSSDEEKRASRHTAGTGHTGVVPPAGAHGAAGAPVVGTGAAGYQGTQPGGPGYTAAGAGTSGNRLA